MGKKKSSHAKMAVFLTLHEGLLINKVATLESSRIFIFFRFGMILVHTYHRKENVLCDDNIAEPHRKPLQAPCAVKSKEHSGAVVQE
jgi:hypothetical protein